MNKKDIPNKLMEFEPKGVELDFDNIPYISFKGKNISDSTLKGTINNQHAFNKLNIIDSILKDVDASIVSFYNCDFKDCSIKDSRFEKCDFSDGAQINNEVQNTTFSNCKFNQTAITESEYTDVVFNECDFENIIISTCSFNRCFFINCKTSNKIIESSLIFDCKFQGTEIQPETIFENFGICEENLFGSMIRFTTKPKRELISPKTFSSRTNSLQLSTIDNFTIDYFHNPDILITGSENTDATFDYINWLNLSKHPNRFRQLIERYHKFLLHNYDKDNAPVWILLKLHKMTGELSENIDPSKIDVYRSIMGVHMSLSRLVEKFLELTEHLFSKYSNLQEMNLLVRGPLTEDYYYNELSEIFDSRSLSIKKIVKHNSPNELLVAWDKVKDLLPLITIFLATRVRFEIQKLNEQFYSEISTPEKNPNKSLSKTKEGIPTAYDIIRAEFGFDKNVNNYMLKLRAILPGNLLIQLHLELRTNIFGKIKKIIVGLLPTSTAKPG